MYFKNIYQISVNVNNPTRSENCHSQKHLLLVLEYWFRYIYKAEMISFKITIYLENIYQLVHKNNG